MAREPTVDLKHLQSFIRIVEFGSLTRAAATLDVSQSLLSRQVRQLEIELGTHLLERNGRGVVATDAGRELVEHGRGILRQVEVARMQLGQARGVFGGKIAIGLPPSVGSLLTVDLVMRFRERYPAAQISVVEALSASLLEWLQLGRLDCALLYNPSVNANMRFRHVHSEELYLIGSRKDGHSMPENVPLATLGQYPLVIPSPLHSVRQLIEADAARYGVSLDVRLEIDSVRSLLDLVERGVGYGVLSRNAVLSRRGPHDLHAVPIVMPNIVTRLVVATPTQRPMSPITERALLLVDELIAEGKLDPPI
ncbi:LysR family nitrogen assimilation transcriptional regulator [Luteibacter sp. 1214]|uniref:LysR substrate-binding domain-containing protein n=1 Tax=Luteibacter sp. 1214 TaxID=2817735 RepID=UPI002863C19D|nr:LysR substrate-binding domain-containing protein [Luteibacter sp. 1214]MDR6641820.1 LysR family nitrogen assimilation transcriptional regulator [Luteibacter sp. 1214]